MKKPAQVFVDSSTNEIKAVYRGCRTNSKYWENEGFVEIEVPNKFIPRIGQKVVIKDGVVTGVTGIPTPPPAPPPHPLKGKSVSELTQEEKDSLLEELLIGRGIADDKGIIT